MASQELSEKLYAEASQILRETDPTAFLVWPRVLRRLIVEDRQLSSLNWNIPHRKSYFVGRDQLLNFVAPDELGLASTATVPERVILISRPDGDDLREPTLPCLLQYLWRTLLHVRVHLALEDKRTAGQITHASIREKIDRLGQAAFDEIHAVLRREHLLLPPESRTATYVEFSAVFWELRCFAPHWLPSYFPSLHDFDEVARVLEQDLDGAELCDQCRLAGAPEPVLHDEHPERAGDHGALAADIANAELAADAAPESERPRPVLVAPGTRRAERQMTAIVRRAERYRLEGNSVRAAILLTRARDYADPAQAAELTQRSLLEIASLVKRLQAALEFDDDAAQDWQMCLQGLLRNAPMGFWNHDARLLYDLQKVCVDHEKEVSVVEMWPWLWSMGRKPLKRPLPNQREVLMAKHLRSASGRLPKSGLTGKERARLSQLLHAAAKSAEVQLRNRLRPLLRDSLNQVELQPHNLPERVSRDKVIEELSDRVVEHGYLTMGHLRDTISRNHLKLDDLTTMEQVVNGDQLLRCDKLLAESLDGVYRRGEFYLRWLQRLSSLAFGTFWGQRITQFVVIPFGASLIILEGLDHLAHAILGLLDNHETGEHVAQAVPAVPALDAGGLEAAGTHVVDAGTHAANLASTHAADLAQHAGEAAAVHGKIFMTWTAFWGLGFFILFLMHVRIFRKAIGEILRLAWKAIWSLVYQTPRWILKQPWMLQLLDSTPVRLFRRLILLPLSLTAGLGLFLLVADIAWSTWWTIVGVTFAVLLVAQNSRVGRDLEELSAEWVIHVLHRFGVRFLVALFEVIMETFKRVLEFIERVLYAVDEWLRFKSGESKITLGLKAVLGLVWATVAFVVRFMVNLLIEPQVNPIKHFPVVTVSHKIILPTQPLMAKLLRNWMSVWTAEGLAATIVFLLPGVFGFLVWELKENWRLFASNRPRRLLPVLVGSHGETLIRLMKPGFHSGTLPKLFAKLRRAERKAHLPKWKHSRAVLHDKLHHISESLQHFIERELLAFLQLSRGWGEFPLEVKHVEVACNSIRVEIEAPYAPGSPLELLFEEQSGWLVASISRLGWLRQISPAQHQTLWLTLVGVYKIAGVDLIREQIAGLFSPRKYPYDIGERGLVIWVTEEYNVEVYYPLQQRRLLMARPWRVAREHHLPDLDARALIFSLNPITWRKWVEAWDAESTGQPLPTLFPDELRLLPDLNELILDRNT